MKLSLWSGHILIGLLAVRNLSLYTQQWYMSYRLQLQLVSRIRTECPDPAHKLSANLYVLLCVQWKTPDDGQRNCLKHVEFYSKNKFQKLVHLVGFIIRTKPTTGKSHILSSDSPPCQRFCILFHDRVTNKMRNSNLSRIMALRTLPLWNYVLWNMRLFSSYIKDIKIKM